MAKQKRLSLKKRIQKDNQLYRQTITSLRSYSYQQWLILIRKKINHQNIYLRPEYLVVYADMALRLAAKKHNELEDPRKEQCKLLNTAEVNLSDRGEKTLVKLFGVCAVPLIASWQNRFHYRQGNMVGRMQVLYENYKDDIKKATGITIEEIFVITLILLGIYEDKQKVFFTPKVITSKDIKSLSQENIDKYLSFFSITKDQYIKLAKKDKIYEKDFGRFKYLYRYPIVNLEDNTYIIPVFEQLVDSVSYNLYYVLLEYFSNQSSSASRKFLDEFGIEFENYITNLMKDTLGEDSVKRADDIVTTDSDDRCEAVGFYENKALAIEVKKMNFKKDAIVNKDKEHIDKLLKEKIAKAFNQIETTFKYLDEYECYGLIVIPETIMTSSTMIPYLKENFPDKAEYNDNIFICSASAFEELMANNNKNIFEVLHYTKNRDFNEGNDISLVIQNMINEGYELTTVNEKLHNASEKVLDLLEGK